MEEVFPLPLGANSKLKFLTNKHLANLPQLLCVSCVPSPINRLTDLAINYVFP